MEQLTGSLSAVSLETMQASPITDRLPVEIRLQIFRLVLQSNSKFVKPVRRGLLEPHQSLDTALFAVSREISQEAQDVFFELHAVNATDLDANSTSIPFFRHIEFRGGATLPLWPARILRACSPKLKTVVLARENLTSNISLRSYLKGHKPNIRLHCPKLGLYKLEPDEGVQYELFVKDFALCKLLPDATKAATHERFRHLLYHGGMSVIYGHPREEGADVARLAWWLAVYEKFRWLRPSGRYRTDEECIVEKWYQACCYQTHEVRRNHAQLPDDVKLWDLNVAEHGSEVVEWATELIGMNMRGMEQAYHGLRMRT